MYNGEIRYNENKENSKPKAEAHILIASAAYGNDRIGHLQRTRQLGHTAAPDAVFREIFIFHYPSFLEKLYQSIPEVDKDEELICMLVALGQSVKEIAELIYFSPERVELLCASVCRKMNVTEVREMEMLMKKLLS